MLAWWVELVSQNVSSSIDDKINVSLPLPPYSVYILHMLVMSQCMRFPTTCYVRPVKAQISLRIRAVWSEPLLVALIFHKCYATDWTWFGVSKLKRRLHRLVWVKMSTRWKFHATVYASVGEDSPRALLQNIFWSVARQPESAVVEYTVSEYVCKNVSVCCLTLVF